MNSMVDLLIQGIVASSVNFEKMPQECVPKLKPQLDFVLFAVSLCHILLGCSLRGHAFKHQC